jgi:hypothetical protein
MLMVVAMGGLPTMAITGDTQTVGRDARDQGLESERTHGQESLAQTSVKNNVVAQTLNGTAIEFENMTRIAVSGDSDRVADSIRSIVSAVDKLKGGLPGQIYRNLTDRLSEVREAQKKRDFEGVAVAAAEGYRTVRLAQDPAALPLPIEVYMLNYTGLEAMALAGTETPDWQRLSAIGDETSRYAGVISPKIKQQALRSLLDTIITGFKLSLAQRNVPELRLVVQLQFDAVDFLKDAFAEK